MITPKMLRHHTDESLDAIVWAGMEGPWVLKKARGDKRQARALWSQFRQEQLRRDPTKGTTPPASEKKAAVLMDVSVSPTGEEIKTYAITPVKEAPKLVLPRPKEPDLVVDVRDIVVAEPVKVGWWVRLWTWIKLKFQRKTIGQEEE
jgi:hypothetical protein